MKRSVRHLYHNNSESILLVILGFLVVTSLVTTSAVLSSKNFLIRSKAALYAEDSGQGSYTPPKETKAVERASEPNTNESTTSRITTIYDPATATYQSLDEVERNGLVPSSSQFPSKESSFASTCEITFQTGSGAYVPTSFSSTEEQTDEHAKLFAGTNLQESGKVLEVKITDNTSIIADNPTDSLQNDVLSAVVLAEKLNSISNLTMSDKGNFSVITSSDKITVNEPPKIIADINGATTVLVPAQSADQNKSLDEKTKLSLTNQVYGIKLLTNSELLENKYQTGYCPEGKNECSSLEAYVGMLEQNNTVVDDNGIAKLVDGTEKSVYQDFSDTASKFISGDTKLDLSSNTLMTELTGIVPNNVGPKNYSVTVLSKMPNEEKRSYLCKPDEHCLEQSECTSKGRISRSYCYQGETQGVVCCQ